MAKPIVNGIEEDLQGSTRVIRIDLMSAEGRELAGRYGIRSVPSLVALSAERDVIYRASGMPDREAVVAALR